MLQASCPPIQEQRKTRRRAGLLAGETQGERLKVENAHVAVGTREHRAPARNESKVGVPPSLGRKTCWVPVGPAESWDTGAARKQTASEQAPGVRSVEPEVVVVRLDLSSKNRDLRQTDR